MKLEIYATAILGVLLVILKLVGFVAAPWWLVLIPLFVALIAVLVGLATNDDDLTDGS
jgi:hypothetical protein